MSNSYENENIYRSVKKTFVIEPLAIELTLSSDAWQDALCNKKETTTLTALKHDTELNGKRVQFNEYLGDETFRVEVTEWKREECIDYVDIGKFSPRHKGLGWYTVKTGNLVLPSKAMQPKFKMSLYIMHRLKKQTGIGLCFFPSLQFEGFHFSWKSVEFWYLTDYEIWNKSNSDCLGVMNNCKGFDWHPFHHSPKEVFENCSRIKIELYVSQVVQYPADYKDPGLRYYSGEYKADDAKNIIKDQAKIQQILQPLMYSNEELMSDIKEDHAKMKKENDELKQKLMELEQWKMQQMKKEEDEGKTDVNDSNFDVKKWLSEINLNKYGDLLIGSGYDDLDSIIDLSNDDLKEIGIIPGHRKKIIKAVAKLRQHVQAHKKFT
eukprot:454899_1